MSIPVPILDSHIHLFPAADLPNLAWAAPGHPLWKPHTPAEYRAATASSTDLLLGYVFLETDRRVGAGAGAGAGAVAGAGGDEADEAAAWAHPLAEVGYLARIAAGRDGGGDDKNGTRLCRAVVPWAPVAAGEAALARYLDRARAVCGREAGDGSGDGGQEEAEGVGEKKSTTTAAAADADATWRRVVKGFRYLLQDKPDGTMLTGDFVAGVRLLGRRGFAFDVGVDLHRRGRGQLEECVELVERAHEGLETAEKVVFILNHLCKPDLTIDNPETDPGFIAWRTAMFTLSKADNVYMKLSGCLSEMTPELARASPHAIFEAISPWLAVVVATFGPGRIMFGSDWPVCTVGLDTEAAAGPGPGEGEGAWDKWRMVVERMCDMYGFDEEQTRQIFAGTARRAYGIE